jgi:putative addiction module killer protein
MQSSSPRELIIYETETGDEPFVFWLESLRDRKAKAIIQKRLDRVSLGNFGDCKSVGDGVHELRIDYGPGYRIYFAQAGLLIVLLLCGGEKNTQAQDILLAKQFWGIFQQRKDKNE